MNRLLTTSLIAALTLVTVAASFLKVDDVIKEPKKFDKKEITVRGRVSDFNERTSQRGNKYTTFKLRGEKQTLNVYVREHLTPKPKNGDIAEVRGIFRETKNVGQRVFKNEIDASKVDGKKFGVKVIPTK